MTASRNGAGPESDPRRDVVDVTVIGGGPTGLAAAYYAGHRAASVRIVEALEQLGGQTGAIYPEKHIFDVAGHAKVNGQDLVDLCAQQGLQFDAEVLLGESVDAMAHHVDEHGDCLLALTTSRGSRLLSRAVIVAAGHGAFTPRKLPIAGIDEWEGRGVHYFVREKAAFSRKRCVIVGGGDSALDWTLGLHDCTEPPLALVHRRERFRAVEASVNEARELERSGALRILTEAQVTELHGSDVLEAVTIEHGESGALSTLPCDALITLLGFHAHLGPIADWGLELHGKKQIRVDPTTCETSLPGVYAAGDIAGYDGKITLITIGFAEAAIAANNAVARFRNEKAQPSYSTE